MIRLGEEGMKEFRLKKKVNNLVWDLVWGSVKVSITRSVNNSHSISVVDTVVSQSSGPLFVWSSVRNNVRRTFEQK